MATIINFGHNFIPYLQIWPPDYHITISWVNYSNEWLWMSLQVSYTFLIFIHETFIKRLKRLLQIKSLDLLLDALSSNRSKTKMWFTRNAKNWEVVIIRPLSTLFWFFLLFFSHLPVIIIESLWLVDPFTLSIHYEIRLNIMTFVQTDLDNFW